MWTDRVCLDGPCERWDRRSCSRTRFHGHSSRSLSPTLCTNISRERMGRFFNSVVVGFRRAGYRIWTFCQETLYLQLCVSIVCANLRSVVRRPRGHTPAVSHHDSRPSFNDAQQEALTGLAAAPLNHSQAKMQALIRDGNRCIISRVVDEAAYLENRAQHPNGQADLTLCAHIFDESTNYSPVIVENTPPKVRATAAQDDQQEFAGNVWTIMQYMGYSEIANDLGGSRIHRLGNVITLTPLLFNYFEDSALLLGGNRSS
ncbi:hypothetical protein CYLTODRAFT_494928 [Cylindrobasidium torrendii FP15055 ss-10]|uniref:HNH nuclease domain-containing protein n=1 Tax=Cylindrobasidium torrendii FP15055 ss-10 TaxID=1314674 RepID=A0A0D7AUF7_9AGAR|nr:hypothetical protein CYLTODRAFT_494928 [Cylindrobasidium torrendii FP15055 ss-10]